MKTTIELAREAGFETMLRKGKILGFDRDGDYTEELKAFEALVRADQDEKYKWDIHSCGPSCTKAACVAMREAVLAEREACAQVVEEYPHWLGMTAKAEIANAIRARGNI
jgi:hypothetical protein